MNTIWVLGAVVTKRPFPSLVTRVTVPVAATAKLQPVIPTSASRKSLRIRPRTKRVISSGTLSPVYPFLAAKTSRIRSRFLCRAGTTIWDGLSWSSVCRIYSPRSVSITSIPASSSASFSPTSSVTMDFDLTAFFTPLLVRISRAASVASLAVRVKVTCAPFSLALSANWFR